MWSLSFPVLLGHLEQLACETNHISILLFYLQNQGEEEEQTFLEWEED